MKSYVDEEIVEYARLRIKRQKDQRFLLWFMLVGGAVGIVSLASGYFDKCNKTGVNLFEDLNFLAGFGFGVLALFYLGIFVSSFIRMCGGLRGKEIAVYRLLLKRADTDGSSG